jgi:hypothetical protein
MGEHEVEVVCEEYDVLVKGIEDAKSRVRVAGKSAVAALFRKFFAEHPSIRAIGWTQYTPHFNDGGACEFGLREFYASTKDGVDYAEVSSLYDDDDEDLFQDSYSLEGSDKRTAAVLDALGRSADEDVFKAAFGDHVMVIATPEGFHVNEYSHD